MIWAATTASCRSDTMDRRQTKELVVLLAALCPARQPQITRSFAAAWCAALEPYDYAAARAAALDYARRKPFFPTVSDIVSEIDIQQQKPRNDLENAMRLLAKRKEEKQHEQTERSSGETGCSESLQP